MFKKILNPHQGDVDHISVESSKPVQMASNDSSIKNLAVNGSIWTIVGFLSDNALRFISNLILTRLLFPEAYGLMALVSMVIQGLKMFSDIGLNASVIRSKHGENPDYLNSVWTIQILRGVGLWLVTVVLAWPAAKIYDQPALMWLIPLAGLQSVIGGFQTTSTYLLQRQVKLGMLVICEVLGKFIALLVMIIWAILAPSVWVLVIGNIVRVTGLVAFGYVFLPKASPRLHWDPEVVRELLRFGRWIFISTALSFLLSQGDTVVLGKMISASELGVYAIAALFLNMVTTITGRLNYAVLFPLFAQTANMNPKLLRSRIRKLRGAVLSLVLPASWILSIGGRYIIDLLYDPRYAAAGQVLQIISISAIGSALSDTYTGVYLSKGDSFRYMVVQSFRGAIFVMAMILGGVLGGFHGIVIGITVSRTVDYVVTLIGIRKYGLCIPELDFMVFATSAVILTLGHWVIGSF